LIFKIIQLLVITIRFNPNVIVTSGKHATWFGALIKSILRKKTIAFGHGTEFGTTNPKEIKINKKAYSYIDLLICVSNFTLNYVNRKTEIKLKKGIVVYNGADQSLYKKLSPNDITKFKSRKRILDQKILLTIGSVTERKGQWMVIKALPEILKHNPDTHYYCIGIPTEKDKFSELAIELGVDENVHFLGKLTNQDLPLWTNASDLFLMTSSHTTDGDFEGFGISVIEAALCGIPAIVSSGEHGLTEAIETNVTGLAINEEESQELAMAINDLLANKNKLNQMGDAAYKRAIDRFTWRHIAKQIDKEINIIYK
jgi:phosphatidylinositol alpha-1,6-mannosyltransferase